MAERREITYEINDNGCHVCTSHVPNESGYIHFRRDGIRCYAHRYIYELNYGEIPEGMIVRHKCDNPPCINIEHLEIGTPKENMMDMVERNRSLKGEKNGRAILNENNIREIRADKTSTNVSLGKKYNVSDDLISLVRLYKCWKDVV
jgi:hypothetical protein